MPKIYQYAVIWEPNEKQAENGDKAKIVVEVTSILASSEQEAVIVAGRAIPDTYLDQLDQVQVVVKGF